MKKVVIIGPESTGKTTLAEYLAKELNTVWVPEYARAYIDNLNRPYEEKDLIKIARGQLQSEEDLEKETKTLLICDTDLLVLKVWAEHQYGMCDPEILELIKSQKCDLYLLMRADIPWVQDNQRTNEGMGKYFFEKFKQELKERGFHYIEIYGEFEHRLQIAKGAVEKLMNSANE